MSPKQPRTQSPTYHRFPAVQYACACTGIKTIKDQAGTRLLTLPEPWMRRNPITALILWETSEREREGEETREQVEGHMDLY